MNKHESNNNNNNNNNRKREKIKSFIEFDENEDDDNNRKNLGTESSSLSRFRSRLQGGSNSFDHTYHYHYRNDEELKNIFNVTLNNNNINNFINQTKTEEEVIDWNDFQSSTMMLKDDSDHKKIINPESTQLQMKHLSIDDNDHNDNLDQEKYQKQHSFESTTSSASTTSTTTINDDKQANDYEHNLNNKETVHSKFYEGGIDEDHDHDNYNDDEDNYSSSESSSQTLNSRLQQMEMEQDFLNNSLLALTSHFAQVQLRLKQIVEARTDEVSAERRDALLQDLAVFANRGIPELMLTIPTSTTILNSTTGGKLAKIDINRLERSTSMTTSLMTDDVFEDDNYTNDDGDDHQRSLEEDYDSTEACVGDFTSEISHYHHRRHSQMTSCSLTTANHRIRHGSTSSSSTNVPNTHISRMLINEEKLELQRSRQKELIFQLKEQLEDLERYAYETGDLNGLPSSMLLERQNAIIEQLRSKLPVLMSIDEIDKLTPEQLRKRVDTAVRKVGI